MSLWRRAPREVYRVYGEDEYLAAGEAPGWEEPGPAPLETGAPATDPSDTLCEHDTCASARKDVTETPAFRSDTLYEHDTRASQAYDPRSRRIWGLALLVAVTAAVFGLVAASALRRPRAAPPARVAQEARGGVKAPAPAVAQSPRGGSPASRVSAGTFRLPHAVVSAKATSRAVEPAKAVPRVRARDVAEPQAQAPEAPAPEARASRAPTPRVDGEFGFER
jgi:hypothetical protein